MNRNRTVAASRRHGTVRRARRTLALVVASLVVVAGVTACQPRQPAKDRPILFIHGWNAFGAGQDCAGAFGGMQSALRSQGFTGTMVTVGFYDSDTNCNVNLRDWGSIDNDTSWKVLAQAFSKYIYETYTKKGVTVDVVAHSMGGLITRGAVQGSSARESGFAAASLKVEDVVTLAAPHDGAAWYSNFCLWGQCSGLKPGSSELKWLHQNGNPQGADGTEWTVFGSTNDDVVPWESAHSMLVPAAQKVKYTNLEHSDYMNDATTRTRAAKALAEAGT